MTWSGERVRVIYVRYLKLNNFNEDIFNYQFYTKLINLKKKLSYARYDIHTPLFKPTYQFKIHDPVVKEQFLGSMNEI